MSTQRLVAVLGDVVGSRQYPDRRELQRILIEAFEKVADKVPGIQDLSMTVGDEFQAIYPRMEDALEACLRLRLHLIESEVRVRIGIGVGEVAKLDDQPDPYGQDGSAWWAARRVLEQISRSEQAPGHHRASWAVSATGSREDLLLSALLTLEDYVIGRLDEVDANIVLGFLDGLSATVIAGRLGINKSAVSRRASRNGLRHLVDAHGRLQDE